jgi:hypothetical protein
VISDISATPIASLENSVTLQTAQTASTPPTAYIAPTAPTSPSAPVIKRASRRRHADYSEAELAEWEIKKKAKKAAALNTPDASD